MEKEKSGKFRRNLLTAMFIVSAVGLLFALFFPLIIWDALGSGAMHFMQYGRVSVSGASDGSSSATFLYGLGYTLSHMDGGTFIPAQLFSAQWRVVMDVTELSAAADGLGVITMILTVLLFVSLLAMTVIYVLARFTKIPVMTTIAKYMSVSAAAIELITTIWFLIIIFAMAGKVSPFGFRSYDFMAYGGIKLIIETVFSAAMCALNIILFINIVREKA